MRYFERGDCFKFRVYMPLGVKESVTDLSPCLFIERVQEEMR